MSKELNSRKKKILQSIIEEYIDTAEPVSSGNLVEELECSSATIRNDMADLERDGFLIKPHTSAGRVPSEKGYRYYVTQLLREDTLSRKEVEFIKNSLEAKVNNLEELAEIATTTLSEITHYTAINIGPDVGKHIITDIKFVLLGTRVLMAIIMTDSGIIRESVIKFDEDITQKQVNDLSSIFKNKIVGNRLDKIDIPIDEYLKDELDTSIELIEKVISEINKVLVESSKVKIEGPNMLTEFPEFKRSDVAKEFLDMVNSKEDLAFDILNSNEEDINVYIGNENGGEEFKNFSIVSFNHLIEGKDIGTIGIIGPKRMDYSKVIAVMKYISKKLNDGFEKGKY